MGQQHFQKAKLYRIVVHSQLIEEQQKNKTNHIS